ncbi:MAG TPA: hypothetical protein VHW23_19790 [Kofleriaceae bacterium]|jgi:hypothetical protein|nr:hypothetical protein [Kofleriaceae bacterium]
MKIRHVLLAQASLYAALLAAPGVAGATNNYPGLQCVALSGAVQANSNGHVQNSGATTATVMCPVFVDAGSSGLGSSGTPVAFAARQAADEAARIEAEDPTAPDREATAMATRCDAKVASEPVDKEWSREKNTQFVAFFARAPLAGTRVRAVDCRTTMCRIQLAHATVGDRGRFIQSFSDLAGPTGTVFAHIETEDDLDVEVYVTRDGVGLP